MKSVKIQDTITNRDSRSLRAYFQDLKEIKILNHDEEYEIAVLAYEGDEKAREDLVRHNLRFVISVAKQYETKDLKLEDLINEGNTGLVVAATKFDPSRGFKFLSYAVWWVRRYILSYIAENGKIIRLPNNKINMINKIKENYNKLEQRLERQPSFNEMLDNLSGQYSKDEISFYYDSLSSGSVASLDVQVGVGSDGASTALSNLISDSSGIDASFYTDQTDREYRQSNLLNGIEKNVEKEVLNLLYGLDGKAPLSLKTIGFLLALTSERVRQIRDIALDQLRVNLTE